MFPFEDGQLGRPGQIADDMVQLGIHLIQRLLHVLHLTGGQLHKAVPVAHEGAYLADGLWLTQGGAQKSDRVKVLQPFAVGAVRLPTRNVFHVMSIDEKNFEAARSENREKRNPIGHPPTPWRRCRFRSVSASQLPPAARR
jgi:hypothetical protein